MDTPLEEQHQFRHVTCNIAVSEHEIVGQGTLSLSVIEPVIPCSQVNFVYLTCVDQTVTYLFVFISYVG